MKLSLNILSTTKRVSIKKRRMSRELPGKSMTRSKRIKMKESENFRRNKISTNSKPSILRKI
jgi:hypothetical protein